MLSRNRRGSSVPPAGKRAHRGAPHWCRRALAALLVVALAAWGSTASALTATPTATATPNTTTLSGRVYDASQGVHAGIAGARVEFHIAGWGAGVVATDANGAFQSGTLPLQPDSWVVVEVVAAGFFPASQSYHGVELLGRPALSFGLEPRVENTIRGLVFDAARGRSAGVAGAQVSYLRDQGRETVIADAQGAFTLILALPENDTLAVWVNAEGYAPTLQTYDVLEVRQAGAIEIGLEAAPERMDTQISGIVFDALAGAGAPIADAAVDYVYHNSRGAFPDIPGTVRSGPDGRYSFTVPVGDGDWIELDVGAPGFATLKVYLTDEQLSGAAPADVGLARLGGLIQVEPAALTLECSGDFDVAITNVGPPGETLVILTIQFGFHYSQGVYGFDFTWDLSHVEFPVALASGEQLVFPVSFDGAGKRFPSRLFVTVISGARDSADGAGGGDYFGRIEGCCAGDCDSDGTVSINELIRSVGIALGDEAVHACGAIHQDADLAVSIHELVAAVANALEGCRLPGATPTFPPASATAAGGTTPSFTPTPTPAGVEAVLQGVIEDECSINGPGPTFETADATEDGYRLFCLPSPGHQTEAELVRYADGAAASAAFATASAAGETRAFHDLPAVYWERPFFEDTPPGGGAHRYLVWQLGCWVITVHSADDTHFLVAPQPIALSDAILTDAREPLLNECVAAP